MSKKPINKPINKKTKKQTVTSSGLPRLEQVIKLLSEYQLAELEWQNADEVIRLKTLSAFQAVPQPSAYCRMSHENISKSGQSGGHSAIVGPSLGNDLSGGESFFLAQGVNPVRAAAPLGNTQETISASQASAFMQAAALSAVSKVEAAEAVAPVVGRQVLSPFVGTFYRSASPSSEPYAKEGMSIKQGDVLCIIEAMKLMNEIEAEFSGKIISILAENGQPVEFGEPLFLVEPGI